MSKQQSFGILPSVETITQAPELRPAQPPPVQVTPLAASSTEQSQPPTSMSLKILKSPEKITLDSLRHARTELLLSKILKGQKKTKTLNASTNITVSKRKWGVWAYHSGCCRSLLYTSKKLQKLEELPEGTTLVVKDWWWKDLVKKEDNSPFTTYDLVDIAGGVWYGTATFNKWREEVEAGTSPEIDRTKYYVGLFKDHEGHFSIMQVNKPKRNSTKKAKTSTSEQVTNEEDVIL